MARLGLTSELAAAQPHPITRFVLNFPRGSKQGRLPEPGLGLSRYRLDRLLLDAALAQGSELIRAPAPEQVDAPVVFATGRHFQGKRGGRLFGFKSHFSGPLSDAVELFFFEGCYVGVNCVEGGGTNVCGLGPEEVLAAHGFEPDSLLAGFRSLRERIAPLERRMPWLTTGPLYFRNRLDLQPEKGHYYAGDQLSFVDPFTGTGMLAALLSGSAAGAAAAAGVDTHEYLRLISRELRPALRASTLFRWAIETGLANRLVKWVPADLLVSLTRPG